MSHSRTLIPAGPETVTLDGVSCPGRMLKLNTRGKQVRANLKWDPIIALAREVVKRYDIGITLRGLFYRLLSLEVIWNTGNCYDRLSKLTTKLRRAGEFPDLVDSTRTIEVMQSWASPDKALDWLAEEYHRDRAETQEYQLWIGIEKAALEAAVWSWFGAYGFRVVAMRGYPSETLLGKMERIVIKDGRPSVLLYAGDWDPSGWGIYCGLRERFAAENGGLFDEVRQVALVVDPDRGINHIEEYNLPSNKLDAEEKKDSRKEAFEAQFGTIDQVELDALDLNDLRDLYSDALSDYWDESAYEAMLEEETEEREQLRP